MLRLDTERRLISTVIFLSRQAESPGPDVYCGGSLLFTRFDFHMPAEPGMLVAFRSETTHEVTPVTHGERFSIASRPTLVWNSNACLNAIIVASSRCPKLSKVREMPTAPG